MKKFTAAIKFPVHFFPFLFMFIFTFFGLDSSIVHCCSDEPSERVEAIANTGLKKLSSICGSKCLQSDIVGYTLGFESAIPRYWRIPIVKLGAMSGHTLFSDNEINKMCSVSLDENTYHDFVEETLYDFNLDRARLIRESLAFLQVPILLSVALDNGAFEMCSIYNEFVSLPTSFVHLNGISTGVTHQLWTVSNLLQSNEIIHSLVYDGPAVILTSSFDTVTHLHDMYNLRTPLVDVHRIPGPVVRYGVRKMANLIAPQPMVSHFERPASVEDIEVNEASYTHSNLFWEKLVVQGHNICELFKENALWSRIEVPKRHLSPERYNNLFPPAVEPVVRGNILDPLAIREATELASDSASDCSDF